MSLFRSAFFFKSVASLADAPASVGEIAFVGRSNTGKSSAINALTGSQLAFVSKTPGRTRLINYYALGAERFIVDLPGYGYARVPDATRAPWEKLLGGYLRMRAWLDASAPGALGAAPGREPNENPRQNRGWRNKSPRAKRGNQPGAKCLKV